LPDAPSQQQASHTTQETETAESSIGAFLNEFWPQIDRKFFNGRCASGADMSNEMTNRH
jgi:hypothetical protein